MISEETLDFSFDCGFPEDTVDLFKVWFSTRQFCKGTAFLSHGQKGWIAPGFHLIWKFGLFPRWHQMAVAHSALLPPAGGSGDSCSETWLEIMTQCVIPLLSFGDWARSSPPPVNTDNGAGAEGSLDLCSAKLSQTEGPLLLGCGSTQVRGSLLMQKDLLLCGHGSACKEHVPGGLWKTTVFCLGR